MIKTYNPAIQLSNSKLIFGVAFSILWTFLISFLYGVLIAVSPLIYINVLIAIGFGLFLGYGVRILTKMFMITEKKTSIKIAALCGVLGVYFSWVVYILFFISETNLYDEYFVNPFLVFKPIEVYNIIALINEYGSWTIFGITFKGWILSLVWLTEAGIIIGVSTLLVKNQPLSPFSLTYNKWYKKYILYQDFENIVMQDKFKEELTLDCVSKIDSLGSGLAYHYSRISVFYLEEEGKQYLTVENVRKNRDGGNESSTEVVHLLTISKEKAKKLIEIYHGKKAFLFDY